MDAVNQRSMSAMGPMPKVMFGVAAASLLLAGGGQARADQNLSVNGSFEDGTELVDARYILQPESQAIASWTVVGGPIVSGWSGRTPGDASDGVSFKLKQEISCIS